MGNRAVIALESMPEIGIYVHWNGEIESVQAFIEATKRRGARNPGGDSTYALARLVQTIADHFGDTGCSVGVGPMDQLDCDNYDNGVYWVGDDWKIIRREFTTNTATSVPEDHTRRSCRQTWQHARVQS